MMKYLFVLFLMTIPILCLQAQTECCDIASCSKKATILMQKVEQAIKLLGACPGEFKDRKLKLDDFKVQKPAIYENLTIALRKAYVWYSNDLSRRKCIYSLQTNFSDDILNWQEFLNSLLFSSNFQSPEFVKGFGAKVHVNTGSMNLFRQSEQFVLVGGALASYTFTPKGMLTGGHWRLLIGPSLLYSLQKTSILLNPRAELRLMDVGNQTNIGCWKLLMQGNLNRKYSIVGIGGSLEISRIAIDLTLDNDFKNDHYFIKLGLMYSIPFKKD